MVGRSEQRVDRGWTEGGLWVTESGQMLDRRWAESGRDWTEGWTESGKRVEIELTENEEGGKIGGIENSGNRGGGENRRGRRERERI